MKTRVDHSSVVLQKNSIPGGGQDGVQDLYTNTLGLDN